MKKFDRLPVWAAGILLAGTLSSMADMATFNVNQSIPDMDETGLQNTQTLSGYTGVVDTVDVSLTLSGDPLAYAGDFFVTLQSENGGYCVLMNRIGKTASNDLGYDINGVDLVFSIGAADIHLAENASPTYDGSGRLIGTWDADARDVDPGVVLDTDERTAGLDVFSGIDPNGDWTLFAADMNLNGTAKLDSWGLDIQTIPEPLSAGLFGISIMVLLLYRKRFC